MLQAQLYGFNKYKQLLKQLVMRDLKTRYRGSVLGFLWTVLNPLGMMIILSIVFSTIFVARGVDNFPVYLMCGQLIFNFFSEASTSAMGSILDNSSLLTKVYLPKYLFPLSRVCSSAVNLVFSMVALFLVIIATGYDISWTIIGIVFPLAYVCGFAFGIGLVLATVVVFFKDMRHLYSVLVTGWMYLTPVIYPMSILPQNVQRVVKCNPLTIYVQMFRDAVMYNKISEWYVHVVCIGIAFVTMLFGLIVFKKNQDKFILHF